MRDEQPMARFEQVPLESVPAIAPPMPRVLHISFDRAILATRTAILKQAGFRVVAAASVTEAVHACEKHAFDAVVIGHTVPSHQRAAVMEAARACRSKPPVIALYKLTSEEVTGADVSIDSHDDPVVLINALRRLKSSMRAARPQSR